jgi:hypothetical protein
MLPDHEVERQNSPFISVLVDARDRPKYLDGQSSLVRVILEDYNENWIRFLGFWVSANCRACLSFGDVWSGRFWKSSYTVTIERAHFVCYPIRKLLICLHNRGCGSNRSWSTSEKIE